MNRKKNYTNAEIEKIAEQTLKIYESRFGPIAQPPVPLKDVLMEVYGLTAQWDLIDEVPGEIILGGLNPPQRCIVLNERHRGLFEGMSGLERFTLGHEAGHWEFHVYKPAVGYPRLPGLGPSDVFYKRKSRDHGLLDVFSGSFCNHELRKLTAALLPKGSHPPDDERVVHHFAASLIMPSPLIKAMFGPYDFYKFPGSNGLYALADCFDVSIHALTTRLQQLKYIYIDEAGKVHRAEDYPHAQRSLF